MNNAKTWLASRSWCFPFAPAPATLWSTCGMEYLRCWEVLSRSLTRAQNPRTFARVYAHSHSLLGHWSYAAADVLYNPQRRRKGAMHHGMGVTGVRRAGWKCKMEETELSWRRPEFCAACQRNHAGCVSASLAEVWSPSLMSTTYAPEVPQLVHAHDITQATHTRANWLTVTRARTHTHTHARMQNCHSLFLGMLKVSTSQEFLRKKTPLFSLLL